ncbi:MAG TPA: acyltransferase family protein [Lacisediminihabitans sp.]|uniref:acyltransferase family protein n=1 Tax=Lacisediminihabitans sp. TaxID=2787631 RepID=UPI002ED95FEE
MVVLSRARPRSLAPTREFRADIQGLRAVAVAAVVLNHARVPGVGGGYVGVDVFFVISGFLITGHLIEAMSRNGFSFARFYARRARRILPASFTVLGLTIAGVMLWVPPALRPQSLWDAVAVAAYFPNYVLAFRGTDYLADTTPSVFQHYWSLGVEEQFYLLWPVLLVAVWFVLRKLREDRSRTRLLAAVLGLVVVLSLLAELSETERSQPWAFFSVWTRAWEFGLGGLVAVGVPMIRRLLPAALGAVLAWAGLAGIVAACIGFTADTPFPGWVAVVPAVATALVIGGGVREAAGGPAMLLRLRPFQFLGLISYSLYLVHWPILQLVQAGVGYEHPLALWATEALTAASVPVAWLLYRLVEHPVRRSRWLGTALPWRSLAGAGIVSGALVVAAVLGLVVVQSTPMDVGRTVAQVAPQSPPLVTSFVPSDLMPPLKDAADDNPAIFNDGCELGFAASVPHPCTFGQAGAPRIMLFGDSQAAQWAPGLRAMAEQEGYQLVTHTKSGCASTLVAHSRDGVAYLACDQWRQNVLNQLAADPPALVILANYSKEELPSGTSPSRQWRTGIDATIAALPKTSKVALFMGTPDVGANPVGCLSAHLDDTAACAKPTASALAGPGQKPIAATPVDGRIHVVDMTDYLCTTTCPSVIGGYMVYRDSHHLTATFSRALAPALRVKLAPVLPKVSATSASGH